MSKRLEAAGRTAGMRCATRSASIASCPWPVIELLRKLVLVDVPLRTVQEVLAC